VISVFCIWCALWWALLIGCISVSGSDNLAAAVKSAQNKYNNNADQSFAKWHRLNLQQGKSAEAHLSH
jgi:hypothetical protein